jgi:flagellar biosynthesis protein FlhF
MVMRIKRYEAEEKELPRIIRQIRRDLGENAVVKTKRFRKGSILGMGGKPMVEVYAGVEREVKSDIDSSDMRTNINAGALLEQLLPDNSNGFTPSNNSHLANQIGNTKPVTIYQPPGRSPMVNTHESATQTMTASTSRLETEVQRLAGEIAQIRRALEDGIGFKKEEADDKRQFPQWLSHIRDRLIENELDPSIAEKMLEETLKSADAETLLDFEGTIAAFQRTVVQNIEGRGAMKGIQAPRILSLAGPTGVGKTTTLAKLAATASLLDKQRVGLLSADTYRIAAIDQLKTFAGILDIPLKVVFSPAEMREAISAWSNMDRIFIDTAGRSPNNDERIEELRELMDANSDVECHLVISATTRYTDMQKICKRFHPSDFTRIVFTKIDETEKLGPVLGLLYSEGIPASYLTNGQSVPDDIILADENDLTSLVVRKSLG